MVQQLDLSITLTQPPQGSTRDIIACIALQCKALGLAYTDGLLIDPLTKQDRGDLHWYLEEYWKWPYLEFAARGKHVEALLIDIGKRLYHAVFGSSEAQAILQQWKEQPDIQHNISIESELPRVLSIPWELLHDQQGFLALRSDDSISIVRCLPLPEGTALITSFEPPLRILLVTARPKGRRFIDPRNIARELLDEVQEYIDAGIIELEFLRPPTFSALNRRLQDTQRPIHVLHFDGHGAFSTQDRQGTLSFEDGEGERDPITAEDIASELRNSGVRLVVLTACQSARSATDDTFSSVAAQLMQNGVDAVVAMSSSILVASAALYVEAFYRELAAGVPVSVVHERARHALYDNPLRHVHRRRPDEEGIAIELHDWWLPHFYQQRLLQLQPTSSARLRNMQLSASLASRLSEEMPSDARYGFSGRARELLQLERWLGQRRLVVVSGFGGVGKTALVREGADWLTRTKMFDGACFVSFEHGGDAAMLLRALGNFLGVHDSNYNPDDTKAALLDLKHTLKEKHILVIADNLESILPGGEAPLEVEVRIQLWDVLLELAKIGAGVLLTTRNKTFGDGKLASGKTVAYLSLGGLHREDAYALASRLLSDLGIDRAKAPYAELRDLLAQLDYHPLAIQLVLPALRELPLSKITADFATLLLKFVDDTETGRNRSLLASLDYSLRQLSEEQRVLLLRLALFQGGASEDDLLAITGIPENEWTRLRLALEQTALLEGEKVADFTAPFLRFHPVLAPYLSSQPGTEDAVLRQRYAQHYCALTDYLYSEDRHSPKPVRALVRRELPNLRRALELLLEAGEEELVSVMGAGIIWFLSMFGLGRERDELLRRITEDAAARGTQVQGIAGVLTTEEYSRELGLGEDERDKGNSYASCTRFTRLLERIEAQPEGMRFGRGSYEHWRTLSSLGLSLKESGQHVAAEARYYEALAIIDALIQQEPDNQTFISGRGLLLTDLGNVLRLQGRYPQARRMFKEALQATDQGDLGSQALILEKLGKLALEEQDYTEARLNHTAALELYHTVGELDGEASQWFHLSLLAYHQQDWAEAENCCRESLVIYEKLGETMEAAMACNLLALIAQATTRSTEAEGWLRRALELNERGRPVSLEGATYSMNLAHLLLNKVQAGRASLLELTEARGYAEQALAIEEKLEASSEIWKTLKILADIAEMEGHMEKALKYRRRERETYAAFVGNRYHIERQFGQLIAAIVAAAKGVRQAREAVEATLPELETHGWAIGDAVRRVCAGERDWHMLVEGLDRQAALLVLLVLQALEEG